MVSDNTFINSQTIGENSEKKNSEEAILDLVEKFGMRDVAQFKIALQQGEIELAERWLNYVIENKERFPKYEANWDSWFSNRQRELIEAKK